MEKDKAAKRAKLEREEALGAAGKAAGASGKAASGRQDAPWLHPGITVKVHLRAQMAQSSAAIRGGGPWGRYTGLAAWCSCWQHSTAIFDKCCNHQHWQR